MRFYNGVRASTRGRDKADALVKSYLSNVRKANREGQDYGGSTGGRQSLDSNQGLTTIRQRNKSIGELRQIFEQEGSGRFGARKESWIAKQYDPAVASSMRDRQFGRGE
tara:strand:- start:3528 stop:3854 length:327 start_codon:yes stop_codon:yes gene_type:complete